MMRSIEKTAFLRSLNYLRVSHDYAIWYNWVYPILLALLFLLTVTLLVTPQIAFRADGLLAAFVPVFSVLTPFYIAALAAIATFKGSASIDEPFKMQNPVLLEVLGAGGDWEFVDVTPRHFLCLLFGYCTSLSMFLLVGSIFIPLVASEVGVFSNCEYTIVTVLILAGFLFFLSQLLLDTLLGVYFLADQIHRK